MSEDAVEGGTQTRGSSGFGVGRTNDAGTSAAIGSERFQRWVARPLLEALSSDVDQIVIESVLGLGRATPPAEAAYVLRGIIALLRHNSIDVKQAAILALGLIGGEDARSTLSHLVSATERGKRLIGEEELLDLETRTVAAVAQSLIGHPAEFEALRDLFKKIPPSRNDLMECLVRAMGNYPSASDLAVPLLLEILDEPTVDRRVRGAVPISLARLRDHVQARLIALPALLNAATESDEPYALSASVLAIGATGSLGDADVLEVLVNTSKFGPPSVRGYALVALGELGAHGNNWHTLDDAGHRRVSETLLEGLSQGINKDEAPWASLALGLYLHRNQSAPEEIRGRAIRLMESAFRRSARSDQRGAFAIGLGLLDADEAEQALSRAFDKSDRLPEFQSHVGCALTLFKTPTLRDTLIRDVEKPALAGGVRQALALYLAPLSRGIAPHGLLKLIEPGEAIANAESASIALGCLGNDHIAPALISILSDETRPNSVRARAARSLSYLTQSIPSIDRALWLRQSKGITENRLLAWIPESL